MNCGHLSVYMGTPAGNFPRHYSKHVMPNLPVRMNRGAVVPSGSRQGATTPTKERVHRELGSSEDVVAVFRRGRR